MTPGCQARVQPAGPYEERHRGLVSLETSHTTSERRTAVFLRSRPRKTSFALTRHYGGIRRVRRQAINLALTFLEEARVVFQTAGKHESWLVEHPVSRTRTSRGKTARHRQISDHQTAAPSNAAHHVVAHSKRRRTRANVSSQPGQDEEDKLCSACTRTERFIDNAA